MPADHRTCTFALRAIAVLAAFAALGESAGSVHAQRVTGLIVEDGSDAPIRDAQVSLLGADGATLATALTDSAGAFGLTLPPGVSGGFGIHVDRLGYETYTSPTLEVGDAEMVVIEIRLGVGAVPLEPLTVTVRRASFGRAAEFHERRTDPARPGGYFLTREDMDRGVGARTTDVLARIPVIVLRPTAPSGAPPEQGMGTYLVHLRGSGGGSNTSCGPAIYVDGVRFRQSSATTVDDFTDPERLEGVEVYARASLAPPEYAVGTGCGVILFWTRPAEPGSDSGWKRLAAGLAGLGVIFALMLR